MRVQMRLIPRKHAFKFLIRFSSNQPVQHNIIISVFTFRHRNLKQSEMNKGAGQAMVHIDSLICAFVFGWVWFLLSVLVNNFSVMLERSHRFQGINQYFGELKRRSWGLNPWPFASKSDALPLSHHAPWSFVEPIWASTWEKRSSGFPTRSHTN